MSIKSLKEKKNTGAELNLKRASWLKKSFSQKKLPNSHKNHQKYQIMFNLSAVTFDIIWLAIFNDGKRVILVTFNVK